MSEELDQSTVEVSAVDFTTTLPNLSPEPDFDSDPITDEADPAAGPTDSDAEPAESSEADDPVDAVEPAVAAVPDTAMPAGVTIH